ncbi:hypothetical protein [Streptomyces sp. NPDC059994]|uniref:hypothetical protein n=1 Tax=Streptomyces sp. NPDC059994 TaxID=3347029 RepID=UPI0036BD76D3
MTIPASLEGTGPACALCGIRAVVHWQKRLSDDELDAYIALEQARRDSATELADPAGPPPAFPLLPTAQDCTRLVHGCADHGISLDRAALIHLKACTAPTVADLPGCNCTPEAAPDPEPDPVPVQLPPGWITGGGT